MNLARKLVALIGASLVLTSALSAQVIYSGPEQVVVSALTFPESSPFQIDFNHDGKVDLKLFFRGPTPQIIMVAGGADGAYSGGSSIVSDIFTAGQVIDGSRTWWPPSLAGDLNLVIGSTPAGPFHGLRGFIGARFTLGADNYYGWVDYAGDASSAAGTVYGWAFESSPNTSIRAGDVPSPVPESGTYGLAAIISLVALCLYRRLSISSNPCRGQSRE